MARIYSFNFIDIGFYDPEYPSISWECGVTQTAVIREMTYTAPETIYDGNSGLFNVVCGATTAIIWGMTFGQSDPGRTYMWEGREVLNGVGALTFNGSVVPGGTFRANGYLFES